MKHMFIAALLFVAGAASAQNGEWSSPEVVTPVGVVSDKAATAPSDAIVLFDGTSVDEWIGTDGGSPIGWTIQKDGTLLVNKEFGDIMTRRNFGDCQLHVEWRVPSDVQGESQSRGNSGVFLQGRYEVQVLDSYENETYYSGQAGAIYLQKPPLVNAMRPPGEWNVYDIIYTAPTFKDDGSYRTNPYITVIHNGVIVQNNTMILGSTNGEVHGHVHGQAHDKGPLMLQAHGDPSIPISFRNIWVREL